MSGPDDSVILDVIGAADDVLQSDIFDVVAVGRFAYKHATESDAVIDCGHYGFGWMDGDDVIGERRGGVAFGGVGAAGD